jgi:hypothetical protein
MQKSGYFLVRSRKISVRRRYLSSNTVLAVRACAHRRHERSRKINRAMNRTNSTRDVSFMLEFETIELYYI